MINAQISSRRLLVNCSCLLTQSNVFQINSIFIVLKQVGLVVLRKKKRKWEIIKSKTTASISHLVVTKWSRGIHET